MDLQDINSKIDGNYPLTDRQLRFCLAYSSHRNGMKAIREAGYGHSTPGSQSSAAYRLLRLKKIKKALEIIQANGG